MMKYKKGFTLSEIMMAMTIIGVIMAISINAINNVRVSYTSLTYFAHKNIVNMIGVLYSGAMTSSDTTRGDDITDAEGKFIKRGIVTSQTLGVDSLLYQDGNITETLQPMVTQCVNSKGRIINVLKTDGEKYSSIVSCSARVTTSENENLFCKSLVALTNNSGVTRCDSAHLPSPVVTSESETPTMTIGNLNEPNFTLSNGMRFYLSSWSKSELVSSDLGFRLITVDINGKEKPNKRDANPTDLVTFLILDNGEVYPLGAAADNLSYNGKKIQYLNAKVRGYNFAYKNAAGEVASRTTTPVECSKQVNSKFKCNFGAVNIPNPNSTTEPKGTTYSYRQALCSAKKGLGIPYVSYCNGINKIDLCPPSNLENRYDMCSVETIKPVFRFSF